MMRGAPKPEAAPPVIKKKETAIKLVDSTSVQGGGYTVAFVGQAATGKSDNAICLGHINKANIPALRELGFTFLPDALEQGLFPEIKKIIIIESENAYVKQKDRIKEKKLYGNLQNIIKFIPISIASKDEIVAAEGGVKITPESIANIQLAAEEYMAALELVAKEADQNTLVILDSASRFKLLLDTKADINYNLRSEGRGEEGVKNAGMQKWANRNNWWLNALTTLRGMPGLVCCTFMEEPVADFVMDMQRKSGKKVNPVKREWAPKTEFQFDAIYQFTKESPTSIAKATLDTGRYVVKGTEGAKYNEIEINGKYSILWAIEGILRASQEE
jgi:hypothetical protein